VAGLFGAPAVGLVVAVGVVVGLFGVVAMVVSPSQRGSDRRGRFLARAHPGLTNPLQGAAPDRALATIRLQPRTRRSSPDVR
jgi:hypothetical protein